MFKAVDQIVRVFAFETLIVCKGLQAGKADHVGMPDPFRCDAVVAEDLSLNLGDLMQVKTMDE